MQILNKREPFLLFLGDIVIFYLSLFLAIFLRSTGDFTFSDHAKAFLIVFLIWILVFYIAGLYEKRSLIIKNNLTSLIFKVQIINSVIAVAFFYFFPFFGITPKTNLFIQLIISFILIWFWRQYFSIIFGSKKKQNAILLSGGEEAIELKKEINNANHYSLYFLENIDPINISDSDLKELILDKIYSNDVSIVVLDMHNERIKTLFPYFYEMIFDKVSFIDVYRMYEEVFDRIPVSLIQDSWFLSNMSFGSPKAYDFFKRFLDISISSILFIFFIIIFPIIYFAIKIEDKGKIFSIQKRVGYRGKVIKLYKFRTMMIAYDGGDWKNSNNKVTKVGFFLRKTRIDELPQLWNILKGDLSLIGPRPEFAKAVERYMQEISYYNVRHLIKPGLSGWAQIYGEHPHHEEDVSMTKNKLSYDLFYIKNRSILLDTIIVLKTLKTVFSTQGK
jgi:exopolysaccharide biosynthesis polyprenyl glycosylphosphotransferase